MLSELFWTSFVITVAGLIILIAKLIFKSKCAHCKFCCIEVERNTSEETDINLENGK